MDLPVPPFIVNPKNKDTDVGVLLLHHRIIYSHLLLPVPPIE